MRIILVLYIMIMNIIPCQAKNDGFFNDFVLSKSRSTDIIKFKIELTQMLKEATKLNSANEVKMKIKTYFAKKEGNYKPFYYTLEEELVDGKNLNLYLSVYYDSYQFENFTLTIIDK